MKLYNTLTRKKEEFVPMNEKQVKMYVCGPTVYNYVHIGNARPWVVFDTLRRYFEHKGFNVDYVTNFTDVDDKIIQRANTEGVSMSEISEKYIYEALKDAEALNIQKNTRYPRATEEIDGMIEMIKTLIDKGYAYDKNGSVYFETKKFSNYGKLSKKNIDELESGARIEIDEDKKDPMDFVLWKPNKPGEPQWTSPWGEGRPGWHIECSVMSKKYLGETIDIHAGGTDIVFPHHENEIAQSEAASGKTFARYWMHNGTINVNNVKLSKSKGNFFTLREVAEKYPYQVIRFFILSAHYRSPVNFSDELLSSAQSAYDRIKNCVSNLEFIAGNSKAASGENEEEKRLIKEAEKFALDFEASMEDDFNTADAIAAIFEYVKFANINVSAESSKEFVENIIKGITDLCAVLGFTFANDEPEDVSEIEQLIEQRQQARKNKDWAAADGIRDILGKKGIILEDTPGGVRWTYKGR